MKDKIIARLKAKFSGVNLSKTRLDQIADKLASKITDENEIDGKLDELNDIMPFADIAKQDDRVRTLEAKIKEPKKQDPPKPEDTPADPPEDVPAWAKALIDQNKSLNEKLTSLEQGRTAEQNQARLRALLKEKKVDDKFLDDPLRKMAIASKTFKEESEIEAFAEEIATAFQAAPKVTEQLPPPPIQGVVTDPTKEVSPMMQEFLKGNKKPEEGKAA